MCNKFVAGNRVLVDAGEENSLPSLESGTVRYLIDELPDKSYNEENKRFFEKILENKGLFYLIQLDSNKKIFVRARERDLIRICA